MKRIVFGFVISALAIMMASCTPSTAEKVSEASLVGKWEATGWSKLENGEWKEQELHSKGYIEFTETTIKITMDGSRNYHLEDKTVVIENAELYFVIQSLTSTTLVMDQHYKGRDDVVDRYTFVKV